MADEDIYRFTITADTIGELHKFLHGKTLDLGCRAIVRRREGRFSVDVFAGEGEMSAVVGSRAASGITVDQRENMSSEARAARALMPSGNRFSPRTSIPKGLGLKE